MNRQADSAAMTLSRIAAFAASIIFVSFLVVGSSRAAFSDTTTNPGNDLSSGAVSLTDDDAGVALFSIAGLSPSTTSTRCITVTYTGDLTLSGPVRLYLANQTATGLDPYVDLTVETGVGASDAACTGFVAGPAIFTNTLQTFAGSTSYATGIDSGWTPTATGEARQFRFTVSLQDDNNAQAQSSSFDLVWEAQG